MEATESTKRFRCNISETAKGLVQVDVTAELEDHDRAVQIATQMLADAKARLKAEGRTLVGEV